MCVCDNRVLCLSWNGITLRFFSNSTAQLLHIHSTPRGTKQWDESYSRYSSNSLSLLLCSVDSSMPLQHAINTSDRYGSTNLSNARPLHCTALHFLQTHNNCMCSRKSQFRPAIRNQNFYHPKSTNRQNYSTQERKLSFKNLKNKKQEHKNLKSTDDDFHLWNPKDLNYWQGWLP